MQGHRETGAFLMPSRQMAFWISFPGHFVCKENIEGKDGNETIYLALARLPHIAILEISMPEKDGIAAAVEIRKLLNIPII